MNVVTYIIPISMTTSELNVAGDNLCRYTDAEIKTMKADGIKLPPAEEFIKSCSRFHTQLSQKISVLGPECMSLAQLEAEVYRLQQALDLESKRLDWLERIEFSTTSRGNDGGPESDPGVHAWHDIDSGSPRWTARWISCEFRTMRDAIDAAMKGELGE
jgi:hypothetical protein